MKRENIVIRGWLLSAIFFVMVLFLGTTTALATVIHVNSFADVGDFTAEVRNLRMTLGDNLLWVSVLGGAQNSVNPDYFTGSWHLSLTDDRGYTVGWATNSDKGFSGSEGRLMGKYSGSATYGLVGGEKPIHAFLVYDAGNDGWDIDTATGIIGSAIDLAAGDIFCNDLKIIFGADTGTGGVSNLPGYPSSGTAYLPKMTVVIPEPATLTILTLGALSLIRKRSSNN